MGKTGRRRNTILKSVREKTSTSSVLKGLHRLLRGQIEKAHSHNNGGFYMDIAVWCNSGICGMVFKAGRSFDRPQGVASGGKLARTAAKQYKAA